MGSKPSWVSGLAQALLQEEDVNVLVVDWVYGASFAYNLVVENYKEVAVQISVLINHLTVIFPIMSKYYRIRCHYRTLEHYMQMAAQLLSPL